MNHHGRSAVVAGVLIVSGMLAACGGGSDSQSSATAAANPSVLSERGASLRDPSSNTSAASASATAAALNGATTSTRTTTATVATTATKLQVSGSAGTSAISGQAYSFKPAVANAARSVTFSIANKPAWASFNASTGALSGTPNAGDVGSYAGIVICASDGVTSAALAAFNINVEAIGTHNVVLSWTAPDDNADGTPLTDLTGYKIRYGTSSGNYSQTVTLSNSGLNRFVVDNLGSGTYYFTISAYNQAGTESQLSGEVSTSL